MKDLGFFFFQSDLNNENVSRWERESGQSVKSLAGEEKGTERDSYIIERKVKWVFASELKDNDGFAHCCLTNYG